MKIGIFDPYLDTLAGGEKYMLTAAQCLAENHTVSIFWDKEPGEQVKKKVKDKFGMGLENITFVRNIFAGTVPFHTRFFESRKYDAILVLSDGSIPLIGTKLFLHFQSPMEWIKVSAKDSLKLSQVKKIICNSKFTKYYIDKKFNVKSEVLYPPVRIVQTKETKKENTILHVGRFGINTSGSSYKKQEFMAETFKNMVDDGLTKWNMIFVVSVFGKEHEEALVKFKETIKEYPITIIQNPINDDLWSLYSKAKIYWHASGFGEDFAKHPDRAEHFGISTVEAMGKRAVPIVINAGGQPEIVQDGQNGFLWHTQDELRKKTEKIMNNETLREKLANNAKKRSEDFDQEHFCQQLSAIIS